MWDFYTGCVPHGEVSQSPGDNKSSEIAEVAKWVAAKFLQARKTRIARLCLMGGVWKPAQRLLEWPAAAARRRIARISLFASVTFAIVTGTVLAIGVSFAIGVTLGTNPAAASPARIDVLKTALSVVAGVGGAVALVVAYRRQRDLEQGRFVERFGAAAAQLGDSDVAVRIAGAYAMAGVADESRDFGRRQQCIDVLCGYLRLPYQPDHGSSHRTELVTTTTREALPPVMSIAEQVHQRLRQNDREVRQTIIRIIASHLRRRAGTTWSQHNYDFTRVLFEEADFSDSRFHGTTQFTAAEFTGQCAFRYASFRGSTVFRDATFSGDTSFEDAIFREHVLFWGATFSGTTDFLNAKFRGPSTLFTGATFSGTTIFHGARFSERFTSFDGATFDGFTSFVGAKFRGEMVSFENPAAWKNVSFDWDSSPGGENDNAPPAAPMPKCIRPREWPPEVPKTLRAAG